eukprot:14327586-Alexandrium_andersonii.AAC.1
MSGQGPAPRTGESISRPRVNVPVPKRVPESGPGPVAPLVPSGVDSVQPMGCPSDLLLSPVHASSADEASLGDGFDGP